MLELVRRPALTAFDGQRAHKIPWNDPAFSARMLAEHLSQAHELASRRTETIARQVAWIHDALLGGRPSRVLDLGCGPGLYSYAAAIRVIDREGIDALSMRALGRECGARAMSLYTARG